MRKLKVTLVIPEHLKGLYGQIDTSRIISIQIDERGRVVQFDLKPPKKTKAPTK